MRKKTSLDTAYFDGLYRTDADPWKFASSDYERAKYDATLAALGQERSGCALEVGCSIGVLTRRLAPLCDALVATELSTIALAEARRRCADLEQVRFREVQSAEGSFEGAFDLVVLSEVVYYWDDDDLTRVADRLKVVMMPKGRLLLVHWVGETDYPKSADDAVAGLSGRLAGLFKVQTERRSDAYRLDLWRWLATSSLDAAEVSSGV